MSIPVLSKISSAVITHSDNVLDFLKADYSWTKFITKIDVSNVDYTITGTTNQYIGYTALTAIRTITLPPATTAGQIIIIGDSCGNCSETSAIYLKINRTGTDTISSGLTTIALPISWGYITLISSGSGIWILTNNNIISTTSYHGLVFDNQASTHYRCASGCSWTCYTTCTGSCGGSCTGSCVGSCTGACSSCSAGCTGSCETTCTGCSGCSGGCGGSCTGTCSGGCTGCGSCSSGK